MCVKCPLVEVVKLIESYKTFDVPTNLKNSSSAKDDSQIPKKEIMKQRSLKRKQLVLGNNEEDVQKRFDEVFDESEQYFDSDEMILVAEP